MGATCFWGLENNCTRNLSNKDPLEIVAVKGLCSGSGGIILAIITGEKLNEPILIIPALILGFFSYGLSIFFYIYAQRYIGAAKTSAYYALAPFMGAALAGIIFREMPSIQFFCALALMAIGTVVITYDSLQSSRKSLR